MESVLPDPKVKDRLAKLAVGLASECDPPNREEEVGKVLSAQLANARTLPFAGFVTHDLKWVAGFSGFKDASAFEAVLAEAEKSPLLNAPPDVVKKLDALAAQAEQSAEKGLWPKVLAAAKSAGELTGRAPARDRIGAAVAKGRAWAETEMAKAAESVTAGGDRAAARAALKKVAASFPGEPEAKDAETGVKALDRLGVLDGLGADKLPAAREKALKDFAGTRWTALFGGAAEKPAEMPADGEPAK